MGPAKKELRERARAARAALFRAHPDVAQALARFAGDLSIPENAVIAGYWPVRDEADPRALMAALAGRGHRLCLPRIGTDGALVFHAWRQGDGMQRNAFGIDEPAAHAPILAPDVLLVPLLAFDASGHRLGYGSGYYDRTLDELRGRKSILAIGIAFAGQEVRELPREPHDHRLDAVVTERGVRRFPPRPG